jgi:hypothetical protein
VQHERVVRLELERSLHVLEAALGIPVEVEPDPTEISRQQFLAVTV